MNTLTPQELKEKMESGEVLVLDVREPHEYGDWHIPGSVNIPVSNFFADFKPDFPKEKEIVTVCAHGMRSEAARRVLAAFGYRVLSMQGGMVEWNGVYDLVDIGNFIQVKRIGKGCLSYIVKSTGEAVVIDPTIDIDVYSKAVQERIIAVLDTHAHADHLSGGRMLAKHLGIPYYAPSEVGKSQVVKDGDIITFGTSAIKIMAAPGHTPGSVVYLTDDFAFTGDTLFVDGVGRPDLGQPAFENASVLFDTLQKLFEMPDLRILPAHYDPQKNKNGVPVWETIEEVKQLFSDKQEFIKWAISNSNPPPENFQIIKQYNTGKIALDSEEFRDLEAGANRCGVK